MKRFQNRIVKFLTTKCSDIPVKSSIEKDCINISLAEVNTKIYLSRNTFIVFGEPSKLAFLINRRIKGSIYTHWSKVNATTTIKYPDGYASFADKIEAFLLSLALFYELELESYFNHKNCLIDIRENKKDIKVYVTDDVCAIVVRHFEKTLTAEIEDKQMIENFENPEKGEEEANKKAKELEKLEKVEAESKRKAVYGDTVTGKVKDA